MTQLLLNTHFPPEERLTREQNNIKNSVIKKLNDTAIKRENVEPIVQQEISRAINSMKNKKSCGYDNVPAIVYKHSENTLMKLLMKLFNDFLKISRFPKSWKTAKCIPPD